MGFIKTELSFNIAFIVEFYGFESLFYGVTSPRVLKGRSSRFPPHCQSVSFVVWPYINNVKVMISRLKAPVLSCLHPLSPPPLSPSLPRHVCGADGGAAKKRIAAGESEKWRDSCLVEEKWKEAKIRSEKTSHLRHPPRFPLPLKFALSRMMDRILHCALRRPLLFLSHSPPPSADAQTRSVSG